MPECPDAYVYQDSGKWHWTCPCGTKHTGFKRRMDADDDLYEHEVEVRAKQA